MIIDLTRVFSVPAMVTQLSPIFDLKPGNQELVVINMDTPVIFPEYLTLIVAAFTWAREHGVKLEVRRILRDKENQYPQRINFYDLMGIPFRRPLFWKSSKGKFVEITPLHFDPFNGITIKPKVVDDIIRIFRDNYRVDESIYKSLNYCLWEQIDNIQNHSGTQGTGFVVAQNYPTKHEIRICVVDTGRGIYDSLTKTENSIFSQLTYKEAIRKCIEPKVTRGTGMGNGLYHSSQFIKENKGTFILYSGSYYITIVNGVVEDVKRGAKWEGTILFQKVNTSNTVNYNAVFNNCPIPGSIEECDDWLDGLFE